MTDATTDPHGATASIRDAIRRATADRLPPLHVTVHDASTVVRVTSVEVDGNELRTHLVVDAATGAALLVDPAGDRARVLELVYDADDDARDANRAPVHVEAIVLTRRDAAAAPTVERVRRRLGAPVLAGPRGDPAPTPADARVDDRASTATPAPAASSRGAHGSPGEGSTPATPPSPTPPSPLASLSHNVAPPVDRVVAHGETIEVGRLTTRILPLRGHAPDGIGIVVEAAGAPPRLFVGDALTEAGPARIRGDRRSAMALVTDLERALTSRLDPRAPVHPRRTSWTPTVDSLTDPATLTAWRRAFGLPASTPTSPVGFTETGQTLRLRRLHPDPGHADHRFVMFMIGATVQGLLDPAEPFAFRAEFGVYPDVAALLDLEPHGRAAAVRVLHLGAGPLTIPRAVAAARPGSRQLVVDRDVTVAEFALTHLPLAPGVDVELLEADARAAIDALAGSSAHRGADGGHGDAERFDAIVVDVFDGLHLPARISGADAFAIMRSLLAPGGRVVVNLPADPGAAIDRQVVAALGQVFAHVALTGPTEVVAGRASGNVVAAASDAPIDVGRVAHLAEGHAPDVARTVLDGDALGAWMSEAAPPRNTD